MTNWTLLVAFMDEEVSPALRELLGRGRPALVIERGDITSVPQRIFEQPVHSYGTPPTVVSTTAVPSGYRPPRPGQAQKLADQQIALAWRLRTLLDAPQEAGEDLPSDFVRKLNERSFFAVTAGNTVIGRREKVTRPDRLRPPALSVFAFNPPQVTGPPVVVVRAPEMGMQSSLVRPYLRLVAKALTVLLRDDDDVCLRAFGASGAIGGTKPGDVTDMAGSLFVGAGRELLDGEDTVRSIVALATEDTVTYFHDEKLRPGTPGQLKDAWDEAEARARRYLISPGPELKHRLDQLRAATGREVSLTLSFFGGQDVKHAGSQLKLFSTNTEDYHLFRLARSMKWPKLGHWVYPRLGSLSVQRVDVDPPEIPVPVVEAFARWAAKAKLTPLQYGELLLWGLQGCPLTEVPEPALWRFAEDRVFDDDHARECFGRYSVSSDLHPLDPTAVEIAVDMLRDLHDGPVEAFGPVVHAAAGRALVAPDPGSQSEAVDEFVAAWRQVGEVAKGRVWVRVGKWAGNPQPWLDTVEASASNVDRSFYRSANLMALAESATRFVGPLARADA